MINTDNCIHVDSKSSFRIVKTSTLMVIIKNISEQFFMEVIKFNYVFYYLTRKDEKRKN